MQYLSRWEILEAAVLANEIAWTKQVKEFVNNFVQKDRRERWLYLLLNRSDKLRADCHKLHGHLDWSKCASIENESQLNPRAKGIYYDFTNAPIDLTIGEAFIVGPYEDGLFLISPGKLAVYFFHEGEIVLCKN